MRVILSAAMSLDGYIDDASDKRLILSNDEDLASVLTLRDSCDAILVGAETIRKDNPSLLPRSDAQRQRRLTNGLAEMPIRITITRSGNLPPTSQFMTRDDGPRLIYKLNPSPRRGEGRVSGTKSASKARSKNKKYFERLRRTLYPPHLDPLPKGRGKENVEWIYLPETRTLEALLTDLERRGITRLLVEGGASILTQFLSANLADELRLAIAPFFAGGGTRLVNPATFPHNRMTLRATEQLGDMAILHYEMERTT